MVGLWFWYRQASLRSRRNAAGHLATAPVQIIAYEAGVPTISAQDRSDALFALGYVHAQDRCGRSNSPPIGQGRIAEIVGPAGVDTDRFLRTLGVYRQAQAMLAISIPETRTLVEAYCAGINAYLTGTRPSAGRVPAAACAVARALVPADVAAWTLMMAWDLSPSDAQRVDAAAACERFASRDRRLSAGVGPVCSATADYVDLSSPPGCPACV